MDIELFTNEELITELTRRITFAGIVISSEHEAKGKIVIHQNWNIQYSNGFKESQVAELLEDCVTHFRELAENE